MMALWVLLFLLAVAQDSDGNTTPLLPSTSSLTNISVSDVTRNKTADTTTESTSLSMPQPTSATSITTKTNQLTTDLETEASSAHSREPLTSQRAESVSNSHTVHSTPELPVGQSPGLVAVICIFISILFLGAVVILVKCCRSREPSFQKLDEVPMQRKAAEDSPFAQYPPK